jgi:transposase InsO family protein
MTDKWLTDKEIAKLLGKPRRRINEMANLSDWPYRSYAVRGGKERRYCLASLPEKIQEAYAASIKLSLDDFQKQLKPDSKAEKKANIPGYNGRSKPPKERKTFAQASEKGREKAHLRAKVIQAWSSSGLDPVRFSALYNSGGVIPDIREALNNNTLSKSTLYAWFRNYADDGENGLVPDYSTDRGGNGASLDKRVKELIWFYYLHKNRPSAASVIRKLKEKEGISVSKSIVYRYIKTEIAAATKIYFRQGKKAYHDKCESYIDIDYTRLHSMQWVVYDHKTFDFASRVKREDGWHRVRLFLTCIIDKRSRKILGWWIDEVPSALTVIRATRMMVERYGCPDGAQTDNGKEFAGYWFAGNAWNEQHLKFGSKEKKAVSSVLEDLGTTIQYTEPYRGQSKNIERFFGFCAQEFDKSFDSYLGSNTCDRHDQSKVYLGSFEGAPLRPIEELPTLEETRNLFARFEESYNSKHNHSGQGMDNRTPDVVYAENLRGRRDIPAEYQKYVWTRREIKTVQQNGVKSEGTWYYNEEMWRIIGQEVELRVSIDDIGTGYIFSLAGEYLYDTNCEFKDTGITEENVRKVKRIRKQANKHLEKYQNAINEIKKDKKTQLEELREAEAAEMAETVLKVVNGEPITNNSQRILTLVEPTKKKYKTPFDVD